MILILEKENIQIKTSMHGAPFTQFDLSTLKSKKKKLVEGLSDKMLIMYIKIQLFLSQSYCRGDAKNPTNVNFFAHLSCNINVKKSEQRILENCSKRPKCKQ